MLCEVLFGMWGHSGGGCLSVSILLMNVGWDFYLFLSCSVEHCFIFKVMYFEWYGVC